MLTSLAAVSIFKIELFIQSDLSKLILYSAVISIPAIFFHVLIFLPTCILLGRPYRILNNSNYIFLKKHYPQYVKRYSNPLKWKIPFLIRSSSIIIFINIAFIIIAYLTKGIPFAESFKMGLEAIFFSNGAVFLLAIAYRIISQFKNGRNIFNKIDKLLPDFL